MFLVHLEANTVYAVFQDLSTESNDIVASISKKLKDEHIPVSLHKRIKDFFINNEQIESNFKRQKAYISTLRTYIDVINDKKRKNVYYLNLYIVPKDVSLTYNKVYNAKTIIEKVGEFSFRIFELYNELEEKKDLKLKALKKFSGKTFLDLELTFYLHELNRLHNHLLTYKRSFRDKVVCSDKDVGIMLNTLNDLENDPLKRYQFVKVVHQQDLIIFVYSLVMFLEKERINYFKDNPLYKKLKDIISKINNYLLKISTSIHMKKEVITFDSLQTFFNKYKNSKEIQKNILIYNLLESIFNSQLKEGVFISKSIDMTKMFEKVVENIFLDKYKDNLFIGNEPYEIDGIEPHKTELNQINHLLETEDKKKVIKQFPDFLIRNSDIYHIVDAKYKLIDYLMQDRTMFWQVLVYSKLFNQKITDHNTIKKVIVFAEKSSIRLEDIDNIVINNTENIDIEKCDQYYKETIFGSKIGLIGINTLQQR